MGVKDSNRDVHPFSMETTPPEVPQQAVAGCLALARAASLPTAAAARCGEWAQLSGVRSEREGESRAKPRAVVDSCRCGCLVNFEYPLRLWIAPPGESCLSHGEFRGSMSAASPGHREQRVACGVRRCVIRPQHRLRPYGAGAMSASCCLGGRVAPCLEGQPTGLAGGLALFPEA